MRRILTTGVFLAAVSLTSLAGSAPASAASPWWHLASNTRPSYLHPGVTTNEVQHLTLSATKGDAFIAEPKAFTKALGEFLEGKRSFENLLVGVPHAVVPYNATAAQVQEAFEAVFPGNKLVVTEEPDSEENTRLYAITFPAQTVELAFTNPEFAAAFGLGGALEGGKGEVSIAELSKGKPDGQIIVTAANLGDSSADGAVVPVQIADTVPPGEEVVSIEGIPGESETHPLGYMPCSLKAMTCTYADSVPAYDQIEVRIGVVVQGGSPNAINKATVSGGGAPAGSIQRPVTFSAAVPPFGVEVNEMGVEEDGGGAATQAGSHPFQLTSTVMFNELAGAQPAGLPRDVGVNLPPGLIGNPTPFAQCTSAQFLTRVQGRNNECPSKTAIGVARVTVNEPTVNHLGTFTVPLFNLEPSVGEPAKFGFLVLFTPVVIDTALRTGGDYGVTATAHSISQAAGFLKSELTFWGVPGDPRHDPQRSWGCLDVSHGVAPVVPCEPSGETKAPPFLVLPTSCTGRALDLSGQADSWQAPDTVLPFGQSEPLMPTMDGCNQLSFKPSVSIAPDGQKGSTPTGLTVNLHVPQDESVNPNGHAQANVKDTTVALPAGVILNASAGDGLLACSLDQIALSSPAASSCPDASKVGTVEIRTPLLPRALTGAVYVAAQNANPFGSLVAMYIVAEDAISGSRVKVAGDVHLSETGQIVSTFSNTPQLAFEDLKLHFFGGSRAPLATPMPCGPYTTNASITPWSGSPAVQASSTFDITSGPNGSPCPNPPGFAPSLAAGSTNLQAGAFTPFTTTMSREDGQQNIRGIQLHMPPGLSGLLSSVKLCGEAQANAGTCGPESLIGETTVSVGLGETPFSETGGKVYITGPYDGAPFGLSIVNPAKAGPYDLGEGACDCVLVRARIEVDPHTAELTVTTDETGPHRIPAILQGIPLEIKHVNVNVNRSGFTFNPTNCDPMHVTGRLTSTEGATAPLSVPFQVTNCATLKFAPKFQVSTSGKTSKAAGASLTVKLSEPAGALGTQANIGSVKVELPKQLPSQLKTLQKACLARVFDANPAACPPEATVGHAIVHTPLLPVPLTGPAIFVSHGNEQFPSLTMVLQGYGVTVDLVGSTFISKAGITSTTFKTVPDVPFNTFELTLPQGKYAALAANANLCKSKLAMPTEFHAQNGALMKQSTPVSVTGCAKKALTRAQKLGRAMSVCRKKPKGRRAACEHVARRKYGPTDKRR